LDTSAPAEPRFAGPLPLGQAKSLLALAEYSEDAFTRDGPRADVEYRDLGLAAATGGRIGAKHIRAIRPFEKETGWHWHDMTGHFVFVIRGWIKFRYAGAPDEVVVRKGDCLSQPGGVAHNVIDRSDDLELIEINMPAEFGTRDLDREPK
jgi:mannose-6-phosphate isomerase-like protein (cupin superfamily)